MSLFTNTYRLHCAQGET